MSRASAFRGEMPSTAARLAGSLPAMACLATIFLAACRPPEPKSKPGPPRPGRPRPEAACPLRPVSEPFEPFAPGSFYAALADKPALLAAYVFNGDELFPKAADLCSRGRNALLDLELGPGASFQLGLFGPAWEALVFSVALTNHFRGGRLTGSRFLVAWPLLADDLATWMLEARGLWDLARRPNRRSFPWKLARDTGLLRFRLALCRTPLALLADPGIAPLARRLRRAGLCRRLTWNGAMRQAAAAWGRRLTLALAHRLLRTPAGRKAAAVAGPAGERAFLESLDVPDPRARRRLEEWARAMVRLAEQDGTLFSSHAYRRATQRLLTACVPGLGCGLTPVQLQALYDQAIRRGDERRAQALRPVLGRLRYVAWGLDDLLLPGGRERAERDRRAYLALRDRLEQDRKRLAGLARAWYENKARPLLARLLRRPGDLLLASNFYYETAHLAQTRSGFTHASFLTFLQPSRQPWGIYQVDRVLGYPYIQPLREVKHSAVVELLAPAPRILAQHRRYVWVALRVPSVFRLPGGRSDRVSLLNILSELRRALAHCPHYYTLPGFYYSAASWLAAEPHNARLLERAWTTKPFRGGTYLDLDPKALQALKGKVLHLVVGLLPPGP